jgi:hypothetical protein
MRNQLALAQGKVKAQAVKYTMRGFIAPSWKSTGGGRCIGGINSNKLTGEFDVSINCNMHTHHVHKSSFRQSVPQQPTPPSESLQ